MNIYSLMLLHTGRPISHRASRSRGGAVFNGGTNPQNFVFPRNHFIDAFYRYGNTDENSGILFKFKSERNLKILIKV